MLHHEAEVLIVDKGVAIADDAGVLEPPQCLRLEQRRPPRLRLHDAHPLEHIGLAARDVAHRVDGALRAAAERADEAVAVGLERSRCTVH